MASQSINKAIEMNGWKKQENTAIHGRSENKFFSFKSLQDTCPHVIPSFVPAANCPCHANWQNEEFYYFRKRPMPIEQHIKAQATQCHGKNAKRNVIYCRSHSLESAAKSDWRMSFVRCTKDTSVFARYSFVLLSFLLSADKIIYVRWCSLRVQTLCDFDPRKLCCNLRIATAVQINDFTIASVYFRLFSAVNTRQIIVASLFPIGAC